MTSVDEELRGKAISGRSILMSRAFLGERVGPCMVVEIITGVGFHALIRIHHLNEVLTKGNRSLEKALRMNVSHLRRFELDARSQSGSAYLVMAKTKGRSVVPKRST